MSFFFFLSQRLSNAYESLAKAYKKVVEVMGTGKRLLGKYFRVAFFGQVTGPLKYDFNFFFQDFVPMQLKLICCRYRHVDHVSFVDHSVHEVFFFFFFSESFFSTPVCFFRCSVTTTGRSLSTKNQRSLA